MRFAGAGPAVIWRRASRQIRLSMYRTRMRLQVPGKLNCWDWREPDVQNVDRESPEFPGGRFLIWGWIMFRELGMESIQGV